jgi:elongation factor P
VPRGLFASRGVHFLMQAKDIKNGTIVVWQDVPIVIESVSVQSPSARGAATLYKFRGRNVITKQKADITLKGGESLPEANFERRQVTIMFRDASHIHVMDQTDYQQYDVPLEDIEWERNFLTDDLAGVMALIYNDECVGLQIPNSVELAVTRCDPAVRGNSATSRTKPATLETGYVVHVPEYLKEGERIKIDTRTGEFLSRA